MNFWKKYLVFCNGSLVYSFLSKKSAVNKALHLSLNNDNYVEVSYLDSDGTISFVIDFN